MGEESGRGSGRVGSEFLSAIAGRVGSGQRFAGSGRVRSKKSDPWTTLWYSDWLHNTTSAGNSIFVMLKLHITDFCLATN